MNVWSLILGVIFLSPSILFDEENEIFPAAEENVTSSDIISMFKVLGLRLIFVFKYIYEKVHN